MNATLVSCPFLVIFFGWVQQQCYNIHICYKSIQWTKFTWKLLMCTGACCLLGRVFTDSAGKITIFISGSALVPFRLWSLEIISKIAQLCTSNTEPCKTVWFSEWLVLFFYVCDQFGKGIWFWKLSWSPSEPTSITDGPYSQVPNKQVYILVYSKWKSRVVILSKLYRPK